MFKKGQLVRNIRTGRLHEVMNVDRKSCEFIWVRYVPHKFARPTLLVPANEMQLIGNNYKAKE